MLPQDTHRYDEFFADHGMMPFIRAFRRRGLSLGRQKFRQYIFRLPQNFLPVSGIRTKKVEAACRTKAASTFSWRITEIERSRQRSDAMHKVFEHALAHLAIAVGNFQSQLADELFLALAVFLVISAPSF